jgi:putative hemolysin
VTNLATAPAPPLPATRPFPVAPESLPDGDVEAGSYTLRFARTAADLDELLRLRFRVFNLELHEGLDSAYATGRDEDEFDALFHHLMIVHRPSGETVGTYRMQTSVMARAARGFYSAGEFDFGGFPAPLLAATVEIGRACVAREHRTGRVLHLLWRGLAEYLVWNRCHALFGCCSLTSQDPDLGARAYRHLQRLGCEHPSVRLPPLPGLECAPADATPDQPAAPVHIPALFQSYLTLGAKICGPPAIDRQFKTIDFLVVLDTNELAPDAFRTFFR